MMSIAAMLGILAAGLTPNQTTPGDPAIGWVLDVTDHWALRTGNHHPSNLEPWTKIPANSTIVPGNVTRGSVHVVDRDGRPLLIAQCSVAKPCRAVYELGRPPADQPWMSRWLGAVLSLLEETPATYHTLRSGASEGAMEGVFGIVDGRVDLGPALEKAESGRFGLAPITPGHPACADAHPPEPGSTRPSKVIIPAPAPGLYCLELLDDAHGTVLATGTESWILVVEPGRLVELQPRWAQARAIAAAMAGNQGGAQRARAFLRATLATMASESPAPGRAGGP